MLTQKEFVRKAYDRYKKLGLKPGDPNDGIWEKAHYPLPQPEGERWIWLLREDHFVQGVLQSEEVGRCCFWSGDCKPFLNSHWCDNWFEVYDLCEKWRAELSRQNGLRYGTKGGKRAKELGVGFHAPGVASKAGKKGLREDKSKAGKKGGKKGCRNQSRADKVKGGKRCKELGAGFHGRTPKRMTEDGRKGAKTTNSQKWMSTIDGFISRSGNVSMHNRSIGVDRNARIQLTLKQYELVKDLPQNQRITALESLSLA